MAQTIVFTKETKGISVTLNGTKISYSANVVFRGFPTGADIANIDVHPFAGQPISQYKVDTAIDTITVNGVAFASNAAALLTSVRNTVFIADV